MEKPPIRRTLALVGASAGVLGVLVAGTALGAGSAGRPPSQPSPPLEIQSQAALFACPAQHPVFTRHVPPVMHIQEERAKAERIAGLKGEGWSVAFAEPTRLGVMAFVDGDLDAATPVLRARGAVHVWRHDTGPELDDGDDRQAAVGWGIQWALEEPMREVRRALRGLTRSNGELALWPEAGAIFVQWKRPLPPQVAALAETYVAGALVVVEETPFSPREILKGVDRVFAAAQHGALDAELTSGTTCGDLSGALIGVEPGSLADRGPELQEQLARIAGVPVHVVPEEPAVAL